MTTVGIDLGTTNSLVGFSDKGRISLIPNERGKVVTPSVVAFRGQQILIGESAKNQAMVNPKHTIAQVKRWMGGAQRWEIEGKIYTPAEISSLILKHIKTYSEEYLGKSLDSSVITVPAYFSEPQRKDTVEAAHLAGWNRVKLINEPTAAALAWVEEKQFQQGLVLVYDWGGGTFDVSLVRVKNQDFFVLSTTGDSHLGGMDFDEMIYQRALKEFESKVGTIDDLSILQQLRQLAENAKVELSTERETQISLPFVGLNKISHLNLTLTRSEFEGMIQQSVNKTLLLCHQVLEEAGVVPAQLSALVFSGGTTRIPLVRRRLEDWSGLRGSQGFNPEEAVCRGASQFADWEDSHSKYRIVDVTAFDLGVEIEGGDFFPLIKANTQLPAKAERLFTTVEDGQTVVEIHIQQRHFQDRSSLGKFLLEGIAPLGRGQARIDVSFFLDIDGLLTVKAQDLNSGISQELTITQLPSAGQDLKWDEFEKVLSEVQDIKWEKIPLQLLHRKREWLELIVDAKAVFDTKDNRRKDEVYTRLKELVLEFCLSSISKSQADKDKIVNSMI